MKGKREFTYSEAYGGAYDYAIEELGYNRTKARVYAKTEAKAYVYAFDVLGFSEKKADDYAGLYAQGIVDLGYSETKARKYAVKYATEDGDWIDFDKFKNLDQRPFRTASRNLLEQGSYLLENGTVDIRALKILLNQCSGFIQKAKHSGEELDLIGGLATLNNRKRKTIYLVRNPDGRYTIVLTEDYW